MIAGVETMSILHGAFVALLLILVSGFINFCVLPVIWGVISWSAQFGDMAIVMVIVLMDGATLVGLDALERWWRGDGHNRR